MLTSKCVVVIEEALKHEGRTPISSLSKIHIFFILISGLINVIILVNKKDKDESVIIEEESKYLSYLTERSHTKDRDKKYITERILHTVKGSSKFQLNRIILCGDGSSTSWAVAQRNIKYPCKDCGKMYDQIKMQYCVPYVKYEMYCLY